jgi:hypothetical protein
MTPPPITRHEYPAGAEAALKAVEDATTALHEASARLNAAMANLLAMVEIEKMKTRASAQGE